MNNVQYIEVDNESVGQRLDNFLIRILKGIPKSHIYRIIRSGEVRVNKKRVNASTKISLYDKIRLPPIRSSVKKNIAINERFKQKILSLIIYEDENLLVINKSSGIAVHGGSGISLGIIEAFRAIRVDISYLELVHRLDKETSGCLILAKKRSILREIQSLLAERKVTKIYWALMYNSWNGKNTCIVNEPLTKNILSSGERIVVCDPEGKISQTKFKLVENYSVACWLEATPKTGRTHQIRVHSAKLNHEIIGDDKYGAMSSLLKDSRLYLHARSIKFTLAQKEYYFIADIDEQFKEAIATLRHDYLL